MGKFLKRFETEAEYNQFAQSYEFKKPNVSVIGYMWSGSGGGGLEIDNVHYSADFGSSYGG